MIEITATVDELISMQTELKNSIDMIVSQQGFYRQVKGKVVNVGSQTIRFTLPVVDEKRNSFIYF